MSAATTTVSPLEELLQRAGASDQDRPAWLAERRSGVTATEVRELYLGGPGTKARLIAEKLSGVDDPFLGSRYTDWGNAREPVLAAIAEARYGIRPESRVFHAADNPRFLASPDGVGEDFDGNLLIDELKTGKHDTTIGSEHYEKVGYRIQKTWGMRVTGARRCLYGFEGHDDAWPDPTPHEPVWAWLEYDEVLGAELEAIAVDFLAALDEAASGVVPTIDDELDTLAVNVLRFREMESEGKKAKEGVWSQMLDRVEGCDEFTQESALARVTWSPGGETESTVPDVEAAKQADPELFQRAALVAKEWNDHVAKFTKTVPSTSKPTLTVTAIKPPKEKK